MSRYPNDPRWIQARRSGHCASCKAAFPKGSNVFYYPNDKSTLYAGCASRAALDFQAAVEDEAMASGAV